MYLTCVDWEAETSSGPEQYALHTQRDTRSGGWWDYFEQTEIQLMQLVAKAKEKKKGCEVKDNGAKFSTKPCLRRRIE